MRHPAGSLDGAELRTTALYRVDGVALRTWKAGVPTAPMALYLNSWYPAWLSGAPSPGGATLVDQVDVTS